MMRIATGVVEVLAGDIAGDDEGGGFDAIGNNAVAGSVELVDAFDADRRSAGALDTGAHLVEQVGEVGNLRFASTVLHDSLTISEGGRHEQILGTGDGNLVEKN